MSKKYIELKINPNNYTQIILLKNAYKSNLIKMMINSNFKESISKKINLSIDNLHIKFDNDEIKNVINILFNNYTFFTSSKELYLGCFIEKYLDMDEEIYFKIINSENNYLSNSIEKNWKYLLLAYNYSCLINKDWKFDKCGYKLLTDSLKKIKEDEYIEYVQKISSSYEELWTNIKFYYEIKNINKIYPINVLEESFITNHYKNPEIPNKNYAFPNNINITEFISNIKIWNVLNNWTDGILGDFENFPWYEKKNLENQDWTSEKYKNKYIVEIYTMIAGGSIINAAKFLINGTLPNKEADIDIFICGIEDHLYNQNCDNMIKSREVVYYLVSNIINRTKEKYGSLKDFKVNYMGNKFNYYSSIIQISHPKWLCDIQIILSNELSPENVINSFDIDYIKTGLVNNELVFFPETILSWIRCCCDIKNEIVNENIFNKKKELKRIALNCRHVYKNYDHLRKYKGLTTEDKSNYLKNMFINTKKIENIKKKSENILKFNNVIKKRRINKAYNKGFGFIKTPKMIEWIGDIDKLLKSKKSDKFNTLQDKDIFELIKTKKNYLPLKPLTIKNQYLILDEKMLANKNLLTLLFNNLELIKCDVKGKRYYGNNFIYKLKFNNYFLKIDNIKTYIPYCSISGSKSRIKLQNVIAENNSLLFNFIADLKIYIDKVINKNKTQRIISRVPIKETYNKQHISFTLKKLSPVFEKLISHPNIEIININEPYGINKEALNKKIRMISSIDFKLYQVGNGSAMLIIIINNFSDLEIVE
jgi:hypothetical protein